MVKRIWLPRISSSKLKCNLELIHKLKAKIIIMLIFCCWLQITGAQVYIELGPVQNNRDAFSSVTVYGSDGLKHTVPYSEIAGSAFWQDDWSRAYLYDQRDTFLGIYRARLNFVTNELHYLDKTGVERAALPGTLNRIVFMKNTDSTAIATVFKANIEEISKRASCKKCFVQELNQGDVKLLKMTNRVLKTKDSLFGTIKRFFFYDEVEYYLQYNEKFEKIKKLNKENLFSLLPNSSSYNSWIIEQKLQFKKENDFIYFINYYNSARQKDLR